MTIVALRTSCALIAISIAGATSLAAQTTAGPQSTPAPDTTATTPPSSQPNGPAGGRSDGLAPGEIVVTATKRNEALEKVPIQVSVFTDQAIKAAGITRASNFLASVPNVTFIEDNAGEAYVNIRGQTAVRNSDPNVGFVIDGVTLSSVKGFNQDLFDIQQIEVLKGPQSALYGRNAAAGAIVITTKAPGDKFEGDLVAAGGNYGTERVNGSVSGPLTPNLGFSLAGSFRHTDGPFRDVTTGEHVMRSTNFNGRGRLVYDNHDNLLIDLKVDGYHSYGGGTAYIAQLVGLPIGGFDGTKLDANNTDIPFTSDVPHQFNERFIDASLKVEYDMGFAKLTSITSANTLHEYFGSQSPPYVPGTATVQQYTYHDKNLSEEIRLTSPSSGRLRWQAGFYILRYIRDQTSNVEENTDLELPDNPRILYGPDATHPSLSYGHPVFHTTSFAPFASVQFDITRQLHLSAAGRYDTEKRNVSETAPDETNPLTGASYNQCVALTGRSIDDCHLSKTFHSFEPKVSLSYDVGKIGSVYASYGKGFKSGGFNPIGSRQALQAAATSAGIDPGTVYVQDLYQKESSTSWEIGTKARLLDRRLSLNAAVFTTEIKGAQQFQFFPSAGLQTTISIDKVRSRGFEVDADWTFPFGLRVFGGYGYTDAKIQKFAGDPSFVGNRAPGSFKSTLTLGATESFDLGGNLKLVPRIEYNHYGTIWWDVSNTPGTERNPLNLVNGRLSLKSGDRWELSAYADNMFNKHYYQEVTPLLGVFTVNYPGSPRTFGLEGRLHF
jgi:iron complex outermembrane recepter protein